MSHCLARLTLGMIVSLAAASAIRAADVIWAAPINGFWLNRGALPSPNPPFILGANTWWGSLAPPSVGDKAVFPTPGTYTVTVDGTPSSIQDLSVSAGAVTLTSSGGARTIGINSGGGQDLLVTGANTTLTLGTSP